MQRDFQAIERLVGSGIPGRCECPGAFPHRTWGFAARGCYAAKAMNAVKGSRILNGQTVPTNILTHIYPSLCTAWLGVFLVLLSSCRTISDTSRHPPTILSTGLTPVIISSSTPTTLPTSINTRAPFIPQGTPAGAGILTDQVGDPIEYMVGDFQPLGYAWYKALGGGEFIIVHAGEDARDPEQGVVIVLRSGTIWHPIGSHHLTKTRTGGLLIVDAQGDRLILRSLSGITYYFEVSAGRFVDSLSEIVATMTPGYTSSPAPTIRRLFTDDAPDESYQAVIDLPFDTDLPYFLAPKGDEDWHVIRLRAPCDLIVTMRNLPAPYAIELYKQTYTQLLASNTIRSLEEKQIILKGASEGYYLIRVWSPSGVWDSSNSYSLRIGCTNER